MANSTKGSHAGSFAGGFAKAFLAVMQMAMKQRQIDDMHEYYGVLMEQMRANIAHTKGDDALRDRLTGGNRGWGGGNFNDSPFGEGGKANFEKFAENIDKIEGGKPDTVTPVTHKDGTKDAALGTHQILESNLPEWGKQYANIDGLTKDKFLASPEIQDKIFHNMLLDNVVRYGYANTASRYFTGRDYGPGNTDTADKNNTTNSSYVRRALDGLTGAGPQASAIDTRDSTQAKTFLASMTNHPDRPGDTSNMKPEFATRLASAIKQANAEGIPARLGSGYRDADQLLRQGDRSKAAYFDASGQSKHTDGTASDVAGIGLPGSQSARRWAEIASANGLAVPYGYDNPKEWNHTELAGLTPLRGAQPVNAARSLVAGPGGDVGPAPAPKTPYTPTGDPGPGSSSGQIAVGTPGSGQGVDAPGFGGAPAPAPAPRSRPLPPAPAPAAPIPARGAPPVPLGPVPGTMQSNVGGVRGQQPGTGGPIITTGQFGQQQIQPRPH